MPSRKAAFIALTISLLALARLAAAAPTYTIVPMLADPRNGETGANAINDIGLVVGWFRTTPSGTPSAFEFQNGTLSVVRSSAVAQAVNNNNVITGYLSVPITFPTTPADAFTLTSNGTFTDLGRIASFGSTGYGINDSGVVVGTSGSGFIYNGTMHALTSPNGSVSARAINNAGYIAGTIGQTGRIFNPDGTTINLGASEADAINSSGQVAGSVAADSTHVHPMFYDGTIHDLGTFLGGPNASGRAWGINDLGQVVGTSDVVGDSSGHAFIWDAAHGMIDLNSLVDPNAGWVLTTAFDINNRGEIVGSGYRYVVDPIDPLHMIRYESQSFLLEPIPEPSSIALASFGLAGLAVCALRRRKL